jgi:hypothetical protein
VPIGDGALVGVVRIAVDGERAEEREHDRDADENHPSFHLPVSDELHGLEWT